MRPSQHVRWVNSLRAGFYAIVFWTGICNLIASGIDNKNSNAPILVLVVGWIAIGVISSLFMLRGLTVAKSLKVQARNGPQVPRVDIAPLHPQALRDGIMQAQEGVEGEPNGLESPPLPPPPQPPPQSPRAEREGVMQDQPEPESQREGPGLGARLLMKFRQPVEVHLPPRPSSRGGRRDGRQQTPPVEPRTLTPTPQPGEQGQPTPESVYAEPGQDVVGFHGKVIHGDMEAEPGEPFQEEKEEKKRLERKNSVDVERIRELSRRPLPVPPEDHLPKQVEAIELEKIASSLPRPINRGSELKTAPVLPPKKARSRDPAPIADSLPQPLAKQPSKLGSSEKNPTPPLPYAVDGAESPSHSLSNPKEPDNSMAARPSARPVNRSDTPGQRDDPLDMYEGRELKPGQDYRVERIDLDDLFPGEDEADDEVEEEEGKGESGDGAAEKAQYEELVWMNRY